MLKPGKIRCMLKRSFTNVGTETMEELDKEMSPILAELITLGLENNEHPTVKNLFNWLVASDRTGKEFYYVVGPLQEYVLKVMMQHFRKYVDPMGYAGIPGKHLGKVAVEALAVKCPVLEGPWEQVAWVLLSGSTKYSPEDYGFASERLTLWLIHVIGDSVLCPNPYLRYELIHLLANVVELRDHKSLRPQAVESFLYACSSLNINYLLESQSQYGYYHQMDMSELIEYLNCGITDIDQEFDVALAKKLQDVKYLRLSSHVHDVAFNYSVNSNKFEEPIMLYGLTAILKTIHDYIQLNYIDYQNENSNLFSHSTVIDRTTSWLHVFISFFTQSCMTPHLSGLTATCLLTTMEIAMSEYAEAKSRESLCNISMILIDLFDEECEYADIDMFKVDIDMFVVKSVILEFKDRFKNLKMNYC